MNTTIMIISLFRMSISIMILNLILMSITTMNSKIVSRKLVGHVLVEIQQQKQSRSVVSMIHYLLPGCNPIVKMLNSVRNSKH